MILKILHWIWDEIKTSVNDDDWSDLLADPFIPTGYKVHLVQRFPEHFMGKYRVDKE